ncbi:FtsK/SpoIIIE domain-containing protein [Streptomyces roseifaciens]|uniref:FtsK/SpoIIIE domain-containing protein n=1 Tax=Streptomyces roseifaciens TaxID=1488406 RepID=UPI000717FCFC|nr:FtsK/SpoIIIE domain-containing protein [Streptomyces roseifaciens]
MTIGQAALLIGLGLIVVGAALLRRHRPFWYWAGIGAVIAIVRVQLTYRSVMEACDLTERPSRARLWLAKTMDREPTRMIPRLRRVKVTRAGLVLQIKMQPGQEVRDFEVAAERLRHAWRAHGIHMRALKPGWLEIRLIAYDLLQRVVMPRSATAELLRVPVSLRSDGLVHMREFRTVAHELVVGAVGSGKSVYLRRLVKGLAPQPVALVGIDCKWGVELAPLARRFSALAYTPEEAAALLDVLVQEMSDRYELIRTAQNLPPDVPMEEITSDVWGLPEDIRPVPIVVIVDEVAELFLTTSSADTKRRDHMVTQMIRLAQLGRAAAVYLEICGQRFGSELGPGATTLRAQLTGRTAHRVNDEGSAKMALGDISPMAMAAATAIPANRAGTAVVGGTGDRWTVVRSPFTSLNETVAACNEFAHITPEVPALAPFRPDTVPASVETPVPVTEPA